MGYKNISKALKEKILKEVEETKEVASVARKYGVDPSSIFKWRKYGIEAKRREYTKEFRKQVIKEKVVKNLHIQECGAIYGVPGYLVKFWEDELVEEVKEEIRQNRFKKKQCERRFIHVTSHSGYWK
jgi:transposase-like protein